MFRMTSTNTSSKQRNLGASKNRVHPSIYEKNQMPYIIQNSVTDRHRAFKNVNTANRSIRSKTGKFIKDNVQSTVAIDSDQQQFAEGKRKTALQELEDYPEMQEMPIRDRLDYQL